MTYLTLDFVGTPQARSIAQLNEIGTLFSSKCYIEFAVLG